jgi:hypothetical protein
VGAGVASYFWGNSGSEQDALSPIGQRGASLIQREMVARTGGLAHALEGLIQGAGSLDHRAVGGLERLIGDDDGMGGEHPSPAEAPPAERQRSRDLSLDVAARAHELLAGGLQIVEVAQRERLGVRDVLVDPGQGLDGAVIHFHNLESANGAVRSHRIILVPSAMIGEHPSPAEAPMVR